MGKGLAFFEQLPPSHFSSTFCNVSQFKMPEYCENTAEFTHDDDEMLRRFNDTVKRDDNIFQEFVPAPEGLDWDALRGWRDDNWGTRSEPEYIYGESSYLRFRTLWDPPIAFYRRMEELGFTVDATYADPAQNFAGIYRNGADIPYGTFRAERREWPDVLHELYGEWFDDVSDPESDDEEAAEAVMQAVAANPALKPFIKKAHREIFARVLAEPTESVCLICHDDLDIADPRKLILTACKHIYHRKCLKDWVAFIPDHEHRLAHDKCPKCRDIIIVRREEKESSQETAAEHSQPGAHAGAGAVDE
jgi:hypothetical protein